MKNKLNISIILALILGIGLACSGGDQQEEATKLAGEGNKKLEEARDLAEKTEVRNTKLFSANLQTVQQLFAYKSEKKGEAQEIVEGYQKVSDMLKEVSKKFDDASRLNVKDLYKTYAKTKSDEFAKRAEAFNIRKGDAQAFLEIDVPKKMVDKFSENKELFQKKIKEAEEISEKAKKMEDENKDFFKTIETK